MAVSLIVVNFHSSGALERMLQTLEGVDEIVIVDHSEDEQEFALLKRLRADRVIAQANGGYGAGLNRGVRESHGDMLLLANPDVLLRSGTTAALVDALSEP
ncbi:MAG: glycosyltransferase, partial [Acidobacteriota bacterium]